MSSRKRGKHLLRYRCAHSSSRPRSFPFPPCRCQVSYGQYKLYCWPNRIIKYSLQHSRSVNGIKILCDRYARSISRPSLFSFPPFRYYLATGIVSFSKFDALRLILINQKYANGRGIHVPIGIFVPILLPLTQHGISTSSLRNTETPCF